MRFGGFNCCPTALAQTTAIRLCPLHLWLLMCRGPCWIALTAVMLISPTLLRVWLRHFYGVCRWIACGPKCKCCCAIVHLDACCPWANRLTSPTWMWILLGMILFLSCLKCCIEGQVKGEGTASVCAPISPPPPPPPPHTVRPRAVNALGAKCQKCGGGMAVSPPPASVAPTVLNFWQELCNTVAVWCCIPKWGDSWTEMATGSRTRIFGKSNVKGATR